MIKNELTRFIFMLLTCLFVSFATPAIALAQQTQKNVSTANYKDILSLVTDYRLQMSWDPVYKVGIVSKDNIVISFQPGVPQILINFQTIKYVDPVIKKDDTLFATPDFIKTIKDILYGSSQPQQVSLPKKNVPDKIKKIVESQKQAQPQTQAPPQKKEKSSELTDINFNSIGKIIIDAGHGGKDPGVVGEFTHNGKSYRILEKTVALAIAKKLKSLLQKQFSDIEIIMTRNDDKYISLEQRTIIANESLKKIKENQAVLFISIHGNAGYTPTPSGYEVWYLPPEYRRDLIEKSTITNKQVYSILNNIREEEVILESTQLAKSVINGMTKEIGKKSKNRGIKENKWYVVRNSKMPAVLIETGFITNPVEGVRLASAEYQNLVAKGIFEGIKIYMESFNVSAE